jgi:hypothetical protein
MPSQYINIIDRPTYQTEKVKGWERVRMFKGSATRSDNNNNGDDRLIPINSGQYVFKNFKNTIASNYKGTNFFANVSALEDFDSFIIKSNGVLYGTQTTFGFRFDLLDDSGSQISGTRVDTYYAQDFDAPGYTGNGWFDWFMEVEFTFYRESGNIFVVVNGNVTFATKSNISNPFIVPICGLMDAGNPSSFYIDFAPTYGTTGGGQTVGLKSVSLEFIE